MRTSTSSTSKIRSRRSPSSTSGSRRTAGATTGNSTATAICWSSASTSPARRPGSSTEEAAGGGASPRESSPQMRARCSIPVIGQEHRSKDPMSGCTVRGGRRSSSAPSKLKQRGASFWRRRAKVAIQSSLTTRRVNTELSELLAVAMGVSRQRTPSTCPTAAGAGCTTTPAICGAPRGLETCRPCTYCSPCTYSPRLALLALATFDGTRSVVKSWNDGKAVS
jgi:hypothetical protein